MCIVAQDGGTFARLRFNVGPGGEVKIPVYVDYGCEFDAANFELWKQQYQANVIVDEIFKQTDKPIQPAANQQKEVELFGNENFNKVPLFSSEDLLSEIDRMEPIEREIFMEELAIKSDFWDEESEAFYG